MAGGGVGEMLVSAVVKEVLGKLSSQMWEQIGLIWGFNNDMKEMTKNLEMVDAVLDDAERKSFMDKPICQWLKELKSAAYAIEDMMCDFETNISPNNQGGSWGAKLQKILSTAKIVKKRVILANKMKDLRQRLDKVAMRRSQFVLNSGTRFDKEQVAKERETYADINEQTIMGRDKEKEELIQLLMRSDGGHDVSIIAIVGLGGIGKTTLAQLLFNNESIKDTFGRQAWAYVSMEFDVKNIGRALLESFGGSSQIPSTLEGMRKSLKEKMSGKRFFIVLDDLWEEDGGKLEELRGMLRGDTKGSKIVVTTRSEKVAVQIHATELYKLEALTDDHCWDLFSQRAFTSESEKNDKDLVQIGRELVKKCAGVPLAVKSLGYTMRLKKGVDAWAEVRDSDIWKLEEKSGGSFKTSMLPSLKISYILMPSYLKLCFSYCSIFPRGCRISKNELIQQWISLGFIQPPQEGISLEKCGKEYVDDLLGMSFLHFSRSILEDKGKVCMHDLVYDLARSISGDELLVLNAEKAANNHLGGNDYRYVLILNFEDLTEVCKILPNKIRALHFHSCSRKIHFPDCAFERIKYLRVLHFHGSYATKLSTPIKKLKQLRYLCVPNIELHAVSQSISTLCYLRLFGSLDICSLPDSIGELKELVYMNLSFCESLKVIPSSFGNLQKLLCLKLRHCCRLDALPESFGNLLNLRYLDMSYYCVKELPESLRNLNNLQVLKLESCHELQFLPEPLYLSRLKELYLKDCKNLQKLPDSIENLTELKILDLSFCKNLIITPSFFSIITRLRKLEMRGCLCPLSWTGLNALPAKFVLVKDGFSPLYHIVNEYKVGALEIESRSLEIALLENASKPEEFAKINLCTKSKLESIKLKWTYPHNRSLEDTARDEPILEILMPHPCLNMLILDGYSAPKFPSWLMNICYFLPNLSLLHLENMETCENLPPLGLLPNLSDLLVRNMPNLRKLDKAFFEGHGAFGRLKRLTLDRLLELEEWLIKVHESDNEFLFINLEWLEVRKCPKLRFEPFFPRIKQYTVWDCPHILRDLCQHDSRENLWVQGSLGHSSRQHSTENSLIEDFSESTSGRITKRSFLENVHSTLCCRNNQQVED